MEKGQYILENRGLVNKEPDSKTWGFLGKQGQIKHMIEF